MPKYLFTGSYTADGARAILKDTAAGRRQALTAAVEGLGGKVEGLWYAFGDDDLYALVDLPSNVRAAAISVLVASTGTFAPKIVALLTVDEMDEALKTKVNFRVAGT